MIKTWPIVNQMLYPAMIVQPGDQVYGGNPAHQYLWYPGAVPCTDSSNPNRTVYCVARVDSRQSDGAETITWVPVIEEITPGRVFRRGRRPRRGWCRCGSTIGYQSASMSAFPPPQTWPPEPTGSRLVADDRQVTINATNYTPDRHRRSSVRRHLQRALWPGNARGVGQLRPDPSRAAMPAACGRIGA